MLFHRVFRTYYVLDTQSFHVHLNNLLIHRYIDPMIMEAPRLRYYTPLGPISDCPECWIGDPVLIESVDENLRLTFSRFYAAFMPKISIFDFVILL